MAATPPTAGERNAAADVISAWRAGKTGLACPRCQRTGVEIEDRSARPHAEWYAVLCSGCGFEATVQIPLGTRPISL
ncbi:MAG: hypothetical protein AAFU50_04365 [Pseudomonadota bacterium]